MDLTKNNDGSRETLQSKEWQRLSEWIHCLCVVTFDLELGQAMEVFFWHIFFSKFCKFIIQIFTFNMV